MLHHAMQRYASLLPKAAPEQSEQHVPEVPQKAHLYAPSRVVTAFNSSCQDGVRDGCGTAVLEAVAGPKPGIIVVGF